MKFLATPLLGAVGGSGIGRIRGPVTRKILPFVCSNNEVGIKINQQILDSRNAHFTLKYFDWGSSGGRRCRSL